jgi:hypothetical protein
VHRAHWFDGNSRFYDAVSANHSKMDLSIRGHRVSKDGSPINVPSGEDSVCITCDGEEKWLPTYTRQAHAIGDIRPWSAFGETYHGILADFETATDLQSSRVTFGFSFRHSWEIVAQVS